MDVTLTPDLEELVRRKVASGRYASARDVIEDALRLLEEQDRARETKLGQLRRDIQEGLGSGPATPWDLEEAKREGRQRRAIVGGTGHS